MPEFSERSKLRLGTCDQRLQDVMNAAIKVEDFTVLEGHRTQEQQNLYFQQGKSKEMWPNSKHNAWPSRAVDIAPWPIDWNDTKRFEKLAGIVQACADDLGIKIRWGGTFKTLVDMPHFELVDP